MRHDLLEPIATEPEFFVRPVGFLKDVSRGKLGTVRVLLFAKVYRAKWSGRRPTLTLYRA